VQAKEHSPEDVLAYAEALKNSAQYSAAKVQLLNYQKLKPTADVSIEIQGCDSALVWMANPTTHKLRNEAAVNTSLANFGTFPIGDKVFYVAEPDGRTAEQYGWTGNGYLRIYQAAQSADNGLSNPVLLGEDINIGRYHIGPLFVNKAEDQLFITRTYTGKDAQKDQVMSKKMWTNNLELIILNKTSQGWESTEFPYNNVAQYSLGHAALSADEKILYFVSDMPGGFGGTDIWFCSLESDGSWSKPVNAGGEINTCGNEMFPILSAGDVLYYSTDGLPGMGGLDVFSSIGAKSNWSKPRNLGYPVNSSADDFSFVINRETADAQSGYLSSNRIGTVGNDDIYSFHSERPRVVIILAGITTNKKTGESIPAAQLSLWDEHNQIISAKSSNADGTFSFEIEPGKQYAVLGRKERFHGDSTQFNTFDIQHADTVKVALLLEPIFKIGDTFVLKDIYYNFDKDDIRPDAAKILDELLVTLRDNPTLKIELSSHTDSRGSHKYNEDLSSRRAKSAVEYLISRGISRSRLVAKGYGETKLVNKCADGVPCTVAEHQANRRTEIRVLAY